MTNQGHRVARGVTLIESIIYVALTAFLLISVLGATYPILSGAERSSNKITADGEAVFVARKVAWAMGAVTGITAPTVGTQGSTLTLTRPDGTYSFTNTSGVVYLAVDSGTPVELTTSRIAVSNFLVTHVAPSGGAPRAVDVQFDINGNTVGPLRMYARY
jgi:hypothetical protein